MQPSFNNENAASALKDAVVADNVDRRLDITRERCPMTYVRVRLALDGMEAGQTLLVLLAGEEPLRNVPRTAREQGHSVLLGDPGVDGISRLLIRKG